MPKVGMLGNYSLLVKEYVGKLCISRRNLAVPSSDLAAFHQVLRASKDIVFITGAGISAESGIPTFRGPDELLWRNFPATLLDKASVFRDDPGLVWEFYHYRRELVRNVKPNKGHISIANYEAKQSGKKKVNVITQNIDGLHSKAGTKNLIELHGNLFKTRCTKCGDVAVNTDSPICLGLQGKGSPDEKALVSNILEKDLPHCKIPNCGGLLRPHVLWFGEFLDWSTVEQVDAVMSRCDLCIVVGTSGLVHPATLYAPMAAVRGATVAEFNLERTPYTPDFQYYFQGPSSVTLPNALVD